MDDVHVTFLASQIRANSHRKTTLTLSANTLLYLLSSFETLEGQSTSFHLKQQPQLKAELLRDLQFLNKYFQDTKALKLYAVEEHPEVDIAKFRNVQSLELCALDVKLVKGLQGLRPQLQKLVCHKTPNSLEEVLSDCGGDSSRPYCWNELKEASFVANNILELDQSLECAPWLHTLDLSHNDIADIEPLSCLHNLKSLNLSFNKLESIASLKGQICSRLQNLILKNNFIENVAGLRVLTNLWVLDLGNNCLVDHRSLLTLAHLATLQFLNLANNPVSFHPNHRVKTASYLHVNTASTQFLLDNKVLTPKEKRFVGSYYPHQVKTSNSMTESMTSTSEKVRKVRHVVIEDHGVSVEEELPARSITPQPHLETKRQIEDLHDKFGESWLNSQSGLLDVLGLEGTSVPLSASPYERDFTIYSGELPPLQPCEEIKEEQDPETLNEEYNKVEPPPDPDVSYDEPDLEEESIYLATVKSELEPIFLVLTGSHLSERECSTSDERERWHLESIIRCEILEGEPRVVQIDFETMRKDKKQRLYVFEDEIDAFVACVKKKTEGRERKEQIEEKLQCMKCNIIFAKKNGLFVEEEVRCPGCDSTLVVEQG